MDLQHLPGIVIAVIAMMMGPVSTPRAVSKLSTPGALAPDRCHGEGQGEPSYSI